MITDRQRRIRHLQRKSAFFHAVIELFKKLQPDIPELLRVTITRVELSPDRSSAKIFMYSFFGKSAVTNAIYKLVPFIPSIKNSLQSVVKIRKIPDIKIMYDDKKEKAERIEHLIEFAEK
jgi:ribosome-binding factor A